MPLIVIKALCGRLPISLLYIASLTLAWQGVYAMARNLACQWGKTECVVMRVRWSSVCHVVTKIVKCSKIYFQLQGVVTKLLGVYAWLCVTFCEQFVTYTWEMARHDANCVTFTSWQICTTKLAWRGTYIIGTLYDGHCRNKICASVRLAYVTYKHVRVIS